VADLDNKHRDANWKDVAAEFKSERDALQGDVMRMQQQRDEAIAAADGLRAKLAAAEAELERWRNVTARADPDDCAVGIKTLYDNWQREKEARATAKRERDEARAEVAEADGVIAVWRRRTETAERERDAAMKDAGRIDWIASIVNDGKSDRMEIARSLLRAGYEFGWWESGKPIWFIGHGSLRQAIDAAIAGKGAA